MATTSPTVPTILPRRPFLRVALSNVGLFLRLMMHNKVGFVGFLGVIFFLVLAFIVPYFVPFDTATIVSAIYQGPTWAHILGTDYEGRDIWVQVIHGGADVMTAGFLTAFMTTTVAVVLGAFTAFVGGWFDQVVLALADIVLTIPQFPLLAVLAAYFSLSNVFLVALLLTVLSWPFLLRAVRAQVLSLKERDYVEAARALDLGTPHIIFREILPNMLTYIAINFIFAATGAIYAEVGLMFLGLIPLSNTNWGAMINLAWVRGAVFYPPSLFYILGPVIAVALFQLSLVSMQRSLEDVFNPRLRQGA